MSGPTVLIADDEDLIVDGLKAFLQAKGYNVLCAPDGEAALEIIFRERPAAVVLDLGIPKISGIEVCQRVKASPEAKGVKILIATGMGLQESVQDALAAGADGFLLKPFGGARLVESLQRMLAQ